MKRTAKWHKPLTLAQLRHLKEMNAFSLRDFKHLRIEQRKIAQRCDIELFHVCMDCSEIERRLKAAGYTFDDPAAH